MIEAFITVRLLDVIDIVLVAYIMYRIYLLIRGTAAINIFIGIFSVYLLWLISKALNMQLLGSILGQIIGVGVIALIIVFQQEIRRFLLFIGNQYFPNSKFSFDNVFFGSLRTSDVKIRSIVKSCINMSNRKIGALIVIAKKSQLTMYTRTGDIINAETSSRLLETIFSKKSPMHDGAVIIIRDKIYAARCILPVSENIYLPPYLGMRHRAGVGITENTDAFAIIVSEETGSISVAREGKLNGNISSKDLMRILEEQFGA